MWIKKNIKPKKVKRLRHQFNKIRYESTSFIARKLFSKIAAYQDVDAPFKAVSSIKRM